LIAYSSPVLAQRNTQVRSATDTTDERVRGSVTERVEAATCVTRNSRDLCAAIQRASITPKNLAVTVSGSEIRTTSRTYPLTLEIAGGLARSCAADD
jgi:hypothetical protein